MIRVRQIKVPVLEDSQKMLLHKLSLKLKISPKDVLFFEIIKKSIDARDKSHIVYVYELNVLIKEEEKVLKKCSSLDIFFTHEEEYSFPKSNHMMEDRPIIVGSGPAGLFCAYLLAEAGYKPIVFERGDSMEDRVSCVEKFFETNVLDPESNIQFGEGGAGTFSDGKLNTLTKDKMGRMKKVFEIFVENGAPEEILYIHNPHIGTDILRDVVVNMRNKIISLGGEFHYRSCVTNLMLSGNRVIGVEVNSHDIYRSHHIVLAIGHSARDTFMMLHENGVSMNPKNFAVGVRVEHPRSMIDNSQYGKFAKELGSASYKLTYQTKSGRGVYSFCMCPGGFVVNASSEKGRVAVNGMSNYERNEKNANSAIVVTVSSRDYGDELFAGMEFQRRLEEKAYELGKGYIPVQLYQDYRDNKESTQFIHVIPNTKGKVHFANLNSLFSTDINNSLKEAIEDFGRKINGFNRGDALLLGVESRTSSPVMIERNEEGVSNILNLYPCGEGAGYAGGITTAAMDGIKIAEFIVKKYRPFL